MSENANEADALAGAAQPPVPTGSTSPVREVKPITWGNGTVEKTFGPSIQPGDKDFRPVAETYQPTGLEDILNEEEGPDEVAPKDSSAAEPAESSSSVTTTKIESSAPPARPALPSVGKVSTPTKAT